jgi:hypothetical protein
MPVPMTISQNRLILKCFWRAPRSHIEHRYLELSLRASEEHYRDWFDHASDLIFSFNAAGETALF